MSREILILKPDMLNQESIMCPVCGKDYTPNGVGPQSNKGLSFTLQTIFFLTTKKFKLAAKAHDITYLIVPYAPVLYKDGNFEFLCKTRKDCDDLFLILMLNEARKSYPWMKSYYRKGAHVFYDFVREHGRSSFKHVH